MYTVGLDVHSNTSSICVLDDGGCVVQERTLRGNPRRVIDHLTDLRRQSGQALKICFEASCNYGWLHDQLSGVCERVAVAHPGQLRLIFRSKKKNDRVDAQKLAKLLHLNEVPLVYVPGVDTRSWRAMIEHRTSLVNKRTRAKNALRAILRSQAVVLPEGKKGAWLWCKAGRKWLGALVLMLPSDMVRRDMLLEEVEHHDKQIKRVTEELDRIGQTHAGITLLRTMPGVGPRTSEAVCAYIDDPKRFSKIKCVASYFGLVPSQDSSAGTNRLGRITKQGPGTVRRLLVEAAWRGICKSPSLQAMHLRISRDDPDRRKRALVAVAHHMLRTMLSMLRSGCVWEERLATAFIPPAVDGGTTASTKTKKPRIAAELEG